MSSPVAMFVILFFYLNFVLSWGPKWMRDRKPFNIDTIMVVYNFVQIIACIYLVYVVSIGLLHLLQDKHNTPVIPHKTGHQIRLLAQLLSDMPAD